MNNQRPNDSTQAALDSGVHLSSSRGMSALAGPCYPPAAQRGPAQSPSAAMRESEHSRWREHANCLLLRLLRVGGDRLLPSRVASEGARVSELLDRIQREIRERLEASRAAVLEHERLEAALHALGDAGSRATRAVAGRDRGSRATATPPRSSPATKPTSPRMRSSKQPSA